MRVNVVGRTWAGYEATYSYSIEGHDVPDAKQVKRLAGDFESVTDYQVEDTKTQGFHIPNGVRTITDTVVLRDWEREESMTLFSEAI